MPISKERHQILDACEMYNKRRDSEEFRKLARHLNIADISDYENFTCSAEIDWLKRVEKIVGGRIVTISGDVNKNNVLVRDEPDKFRERVMMIDYELCARDYRGRDIGQVFFFKTLDMNDGFFSYAATILTRLGADCSLRNI